LHAGKLFASHGNFAGFEQLIAAALAGKTLYETRRGGCKSNLSL
jgi:hypothetical protein